MGQSILITGGNGFIGNHLVSFLSNKNFNLILALTDTDSVKRPSANIIGRKFNLQQGEKDYNTLFDDIDIVIHLAGIAHKHSVSFADYNKINTEGTLKLARQAQAHGVKRFIFLSTVKVYGESTPSSEKQVLTEQSSFNPQDNYSKSKLEAENALKRICADSNMEYVIVRIPLVYGPGVKANFFKLMKTVSRNFPLPFSKLGNKRSIMYVENLCDLLEKIMESPACKNQEYLVKDFDLSTEELVSNLSASFGLKPRLFHVSPKLIRICASFLRQSSNINRLFGSLVIDDARIRHDLAWQPVVDSETGIQRTVEWYRNI